MFLRSKCPEHSGIKTVKLNLICSNRDAANN